MESCKVTPRFRELFFNYILSPRYIAMKDEHVVKIFFGRIESIINTRSGIPESILLAYLEMMYELTKHNYEVPTS